MKNKDVLNLYEYGESFKEFKGRITLLEKKDDKWNQELWEVERNNKKEKIWMAKPFEWYKPEDILPGKKNEYSSIDVLVIGYDKMTGNLRYLVTWYNFEDSEWKNVNFLDRVWCWKYLDNPPISLIKKG